MNTFQKKTKHSAISAFIAGLLFVVSGVICFIFGEDGLLKHLYILNGIIIFFVADLLRNQVTLQSQLTKIEDKIDSIVNNT